MDVPAEVWPSLLAPSMPRGQRLEPWLEQTVKTLPRFPPRVRQAVQQEEET